MKFLLLLVFFMASSFASTISIHHSVAGESLQQTFKLEGAKVTFISNSNRINPQNWSVGTFEVAADRVLNKEVSDLKTKLVSADGILKEHGKSFNDLSVKSPHDMIIKLDDFVITPNSDLFEQSKNIIAKLHHLPWQQKSGAKISADQQTLMTYVDGKKTVEKLKRDFHCNTLESGTVCRFKDQGTIHLK